jgi:hypothetical protein
VPPMLGAGGCFRMNHFHRLASILVIVAGAVLAPNAASADVPEYQRVIKSRLADAALVGVAGCIRTEIFVSSSDSVFGGRPGPVHKQGLTGVLVSQFDTCSGAGTGTVRAAAEPPPGKLIFSGIGQSLDPLNSTARFDRAWIDVTVPVLDEISGRTVPVHLDLQWALVGEFDRDTVHTHVRVPHGAIVNSHSQTLLADAVVSGTATIGADLVGFGPTVGAHLQQVKYGCQVITHPHGTVDLDC